MMGRPTQPFPDDDLGLEQATALERLSEAGAGDEWIITPPTVRLRTVAWLRSAGLIETVGCPVQVHISEAGAEALPLARDRINAARGPGR